MSHDPFATDATRLLLGSTEGCKASLDGLIAILYEELRRLAYSYMRRESRNHSVCPTELVHMAYERLIEYERADWRSRTHFIATAAKIMRQILVDHVRAKGAKKRGAEWAKISLGEISDPARDDLPVVDVVEALLQLYELNPRHRDILVHRFLGGLGVAEVAQFMNLSTRTVERDSRVAIAWLRSRLQEEGSGSRATGTV